MTRSQAVLAAIGLSAMFSTSVAPEARGDARVDTKTAKQGPADQAVVTGNTRFALDLYSRLKGRKGNLFYSPYSISAALAMTSAGARGETARTMASTLHLPPNSSRSFGALIDRINGEGDPTDRPDTLVTANALWLQTGKAFLPEFLETVKTGYKAGLHQADFANDTEAARKAINAWVEQQTRDKIRDIIGPSVLHPTTSTVLVNAIYYKGAWSTPFRESATEENGMFLAPGGRKVTVPLMTLTASFRYLDGKTFQALELPYRQNARSMLVLLPKTVDGLDALETSLTEANLTKWVGALDYERVAVEFPRFKLTETFELKDILSSLGMADAFDPQKADFSGMTGQNNLSISAVIHKAFVDVNEAGTEAAAATAIAVGAAAMVRPVQPISFKADHPFITLIRDNETGSILFIGRLVDPKP